jgi:hypothetical protein
MTTSFSARDELQTMFSVSEPPAFANYPIGNRGVVASGYSSAVMILACRTTDRTPSFLNIRPD